MKKVCEPHKPSRENQQAPGHLSKGKTRTTVKMTLILNISLANGYRSRLTGTGITWGTFLPPRSIWDVWFIPPGWARTIQLWKMDFKGILLVLMWHSAGQPALWNHHNCAHTSQRRLCWVSSLPCDLGSLWRVTWLWRYPFLEQMKWGGSAETSFWKSQ